MASQKTSAQAADLGARNCDRAGELIVFENTPSRIDLQLQRAAWIARRYRLAPQMARAVADLAFEKGAMR